MEQGQIGLEINDGGRFAPGYLVIEREQEGLQVSYAIYDKDYNVVKAEANIGKYSDMVIVTREIMRRNNLEFDHLQRMMDSEKIKSIHKEPHEVRTVVEAGEPVVTIIWSEHDNPQLAEGNQLPLHEADSLFKLIDDVTRDERAEPDYEGLMYYKTKFDIEYRMDGQVHHYEGRQDFGDGDGSLIQHIAKAVEYNMAFYKEGSPEHQSWKLFGQKFLPYLEMHNNLAEAEKMIANIKPKLSDEKAYVSAYQTYIKETRKALNLGGKLPDEPKLMKIGSDKNKEKGNTKLSVTNCHTKNKRSQRTR